MFATTCQLPLYLNIKFSYSVYLISIFNIILQSMPGSIDWCLPFQVSWLKCMHSLHFSRFLPMPHVQAIPSSFNIQWTAELMKLLIMPVASSCFSSMYLSQYPVHEYSVFLCDSGTRHSVVRQKVTDAAGDPLMCTLCHIPLLCIWTFCE